MTGAKMYDAQQWFCFLLVIHTSVLLPAYTQRSGLKVVDQWKQLEFDYKSASDRQNDIDAGIFGPGIVPTDVDVFYSSDGTKNQVFVTIPRFSQGIPTPATLGTVTNKHLNGNPLIKPYPDWSWHRHPQECRKDRLVSVFRIKIDECNRLWALDTGKDGSKVLCRPQLIAFVLETDQVIHRYEFPEAVTTNNYLLTNPVVDVRDPKSGCQDTFVYAGDSFGFAILVYDVANNKSWRVQDKTFYPFPTYGTYTIAGDSYDVMEGIIGKSLSPLNLEKDRKLFYHAMSSATENWVYTSYLRNGTYFQNNTDPDPNIFHTYRHGRSTQSNSEAMSKAGIMFFGLMGTIEMACWNIRTEYEQKNIDVVANNPVTLQFPSGVKIIQNRKTKEELWILTSRFQKVTTGFNPNETNFRVLSATVDELLHGGKCGSLQ